MESFYPGYIWKKKIKDVKYSDVLFFYSDLINNQKLQIATLENINTVLRPSFQLAVRDDIIRKNPVDKPVDITKIPEDDQNLYYKDEPYTTKKLHQRLIVTYSPKYALYQKTIRDKQVDLAKKLLDSGGAKKGRKNPNDPARFIGTVAATEDGEVAAMHSYLDDDVKDILKVSEGRWQIEECFRIMKTDFSARPVYLQDETRIKAHFLICYLALLSYRFLEKN